MAGNFIPTTRGGGTAGPNAVWAMDATNDDDDILAYRLLGWPAAAAAAEVVAEGSINAALPPSAATDACPQPTKEYHPREHEHDDGEDWTALRLLVRTNTPDKKNGLAIFRRAMKILYANNTLPCGTSSNSNTSYETVERWQWKIKGYFRLIQCVLERPVPTMTEKLQISSTTLHPTSSSSSSSNELSDEDWEKMAIELLKRMNVSFQQYLMELSRSESENRSFNSSDSTIATSLSTMMTIFASNATTTSSSHISSGNEKNKYIMSASSSSLLSQTSATVVLYYLQCILNIIYPHIIQHRIRLLGPTYRSVCEISESFVSILEQDKLAMEKNVRTFTALLSPSSSSLLQTSEAAVVGDAGAVVMAGWRTFSTLLHQNMEELRTLWNKFHGLLEQMIKHLLGFLDEGLERIQLSLLTRNEHQYHHLYKEHNSASSSAAAAEKQSKIIVFLLARITSFITMLMSGTCQFAIKEEKSVASTTSYNGLGTADSEGGSGRGVNHLMTQFIKRLVRACHLSLLAQSSLEKQEEHDNATNLTPHRPYLRMVEELCPKIERYFTKVICDFDSKRRMTHRVGLESFMNLSSSDVMTGLHHYSLAKLHLMKIVMKKLVVADSSSLLPEPTILVQFYQSIIIDIPKCHELFHFGCSFHRQALGILQELLIVLEHASHVLYRGSGKNELTSVMQEQKQQHYLLVSWLSPACGRNDNPMAIPNHPLTNEVLLHILHRRILSSCALTDRISQSDASHLLSLLTLLLFNQQTETSHRRNIATLLTRLLSSSSVKDLTRQSLWRSLSKACVIDSTQRKRQRKSIDIERSSLAADDVGIICWVLEALTSSRTHIESEASYEMRQFWEEVMNNVSAVNHFTRSRDVTRATFLLSLSVGVMRSSSSLSDFFVAFDRDGTISCNVSPRDFTERFLTFIQPILLHRRSKISSTSARHILLTTVCIHIISALSQCNGIELSESQLDQIGSFLRDTVISASANASVHAVGLQYCALLTVSKLGNAIRSNFGEVTLKVRYSLFLTRTN